VPGVDEQTPSPSSRTPVAAPQNTAQQNPVRETPRPRAETPAPSVRTHKVVAGDTISNIAKRHRVTVQAVIRANPGVRADRLQIGQVLKIPAS
jgi:N-acetylmuramoyl-L-alanine amidase